RRPGGASARPARTSCVPRGVHTMRTRTTLAAASLIAAGALLGGLAATGQLAQMLQAQDQPDAKATTQPAYTRLGNLDLHNGFPTEATAKKLYDEIDFQRACQLHLWALPAVGFHGLHLAHRNTFGAKDGDIVLYQTLKDKAGM